MRINKTGRRVGFRALKINQPGKISQIQNGFPKLGPIKTPKIKKVKI